MKLLLKRSLSLVLALVLVLTATPLATMPAQAATSKTLEQAMSWLESQVGKKVGSGQCVALTKAYYQALGVSAVSGNGCDYATNKLPSGWKRIKGATPQAGDIMVWTQGYQGYGHVAVCGKNGTYYHQNWSGQYVQKLNKAYTNGFSISSGKYYANYWGVIRPDFTTKPSPSPWVKIEPGNYYLKSKYNGGYMNIAYGKDADKTDIHTHTFGNWDSQIYTISQIKKGYEHQIQPKCSSSRVVNPYADTVVSGKKVNLYKKTNESSQWWKFRKVSGGYAICNAQNSNVCITVAKSSTMLTVETYTGASNQIWVLEKQCKLSYNANGGSGTPSTTYVRSGYSQKLSASKPKRSGYTFLGWSTSKSATKATYKAGASVTIKKNTTLYAVWQKKKATASAVVYKIKSTSLSTTSYTYNGALKTPSVTVKNTNGTTLKNNTDYTVTYASGRKRVGKYKVTVKGKGKYSGTYTLYFTIKPKSTTVSKVTAGKKSLKISIKKQSSQTSGYQIQYSTSKKFTSANTTTITSYKTTSKTIKSLKAKKTYYVRVRTYKTVNGTKYYSGWSAVKNKKTK